MRMRLPFRHRSELGQSVVEMAICTPLLLLLLLGTIDVARVFFDYIEMRNAVVEGATYGSRHPNSPGGIQATVLDHGVPADSAISSFTTGDCDNPNGGGSITVTAQRTFVPVFFATLSAIASDVDWNIDVSASSTIRCMT